MTISTIDEKKLLIHYSYTADKSLELGYFSCELLLSVKWRLAENVAFPAPTSVLFPGEAINLLLFMKIYYFAIQLYELPLAPIGYHVGHVSEAT